MAAKKGNDYALIYTDEVLDKLGEELIDFAENDKSIHFARFCRKYKKSRKWLLEIARCHPKFAEYHQIARELMASKITDLCFYDKESGVNASFGEKNLFRYDDDWNANREWQASLQKQSQDEIKATADEVVKAIKDDRLLDLLKQKD